MSEPRNRSPPTPEPPRQGGPPSFWRSGTAVLSFVFGSPLAFFILCALAFVAAFLFQVGPHLQNLSFLVSRQERLWHMLLTLQPAFWVAATLILWSEFRSHRSLWPGTWRERMAVMFCTSVALVMIALPFVAQFITWRVAPSVDTTGLASMAEFRTKTLIMSIIGAAVGALHASSLFCVHVQLLGQLRESPPHGKQVEAGDLDEDVLRYQRFRSRLRRFLDLAAFNIGISILSVGILRNLLNEAFPARPELFPATAVLGYGFYFTALIASVYLPIRKTLADVGEALSDRLIRQTLGTRATWKERSQEQQAARTYLGLQESTFQELQQGLSVLSPLLASLSSLALGTGV
ncbi:hypothetical protein [Archangium lansingense]|uniref:ABC transmembrane type-1 domain-containing protein n=1 Tax=Archangium lansingense TaxID=2995310 RepID=A0ABT4AB92_9BACT|nr:hypothetical protein [Archangium lansinium]MCY1078895.1 hypothetical protein [Archangium lansinium]